MRNATSDSSYGLDADRAARPSRASAYRPSRTRHSSRSTRTLSRRSSSRCRSTSANGPGSPASGSPSNRASAADNRSTAVAGSPDAFARRAPSMCSARSAASSWTPSATRRYPPLLRGSTNPPARCPPRRGPAATRRCSWAVPCGRSSVARPPDPVEQLLVAHQESRTQRQRGQHGLSPDGAQGQLRPATPGPHRPEHGKPEPSTRTRAHPKPPLRSAHHQNFIRIAACAAMVCKCPSKPRGSTAGEHRRARCAGRRPLAGKWPPPPEEGTRT